MSLFLCSLTGEVPKKPVVNTKDNRVYEEKNIKKYLNFSTVDPFNHSQNISEKDLKAIPIKETHTTQDQIFSEYIDRLKTYNYVTNAEKNDIFDNAHNHLKAFNIGRLLDSFSLRFSYF
jgi:SUMO ligase MMS21 Smc5/6 complex component